MHDPLNVKFALKHFSQLQMFADWYRLIWVCEGGNSGVDALLNTEN